MSNAEVIRYIRVGLILTLGVAFVAGTVTLIYSLVTGILGGAPFQSGGKSGPNMPVAVSGAGALTVRARGWDKNDLDEYGNPCTRLNPGWLGFLNTTRVRLEGVSDWSHPPLNATDGKNVNRFLRSPWEMHLRTRDMKGSSSDDQQDSTSEGIKLYSTQKCATNSEGISVLGESLTHGIYTTQKTGYYYDFGDFASNNNDQLDEDQSTHKRRFRHSNCKQGSVGCSLGDADESEHLALIEISELDPATGKPRHTYRYRCLDGVCTISIGKL
jgi:hypothetical protein